MTTVLIVLAAWLVLVTLVLAICAAAGRADAVSDKTSRDAARAEGSSGQGLEQPAAGAVVADVARLRTRLDAAAVLLRAHRVAVVVMGEDAAREVAAGGREDPLDSAQGIECAIDHQTSIVASRPEGGMPFEEEDRRLLDALPGVLHDVLVVQGRRPGRRGGRFSRARLIPTRR